MESTLFTSNKRMSRNDRRSLRAVRILGLHGADRVLAVARPCCMGMLSVNEMSYTYGKWDSGFRNIIIDFQMRL